LLINLKYKPRTSKRLAIKVLVFEYITGGGLSQEEIPASLAKEGMLMMQAIIDELTDNASIVITVLVDYRFKNIQLASNVNIVFVHEHQCVYQLLPSLLDIVDFIWPVAPEMDGELVKLTQLIEKKDVVLLNSSSAAITVCSDKLVTSNTLKEAGLDVIESMQWDQFSQNYPAPWVIKSKYGVGCLDNYFIANKEQLIKITKRIDNKKDYVIQPYIKGKVLSLSCLFKQGKAWLLCCNKQDVVINKGQFELKACIVNISDDNNDLYQKIIDQVASSIPGLFAYVGIDIILTENNVPMILEINPRLTTSYVGINQAIGYNVANAVIEMTQNDPIIRKTANKHISVSI